MERDILYVYREMEKREGNKIYENLNEMFLKY